MTGNNKGARSRKRERTETENDTDDEWETDIEDTVGEKKEKSEPLSLDIKRLSMDTWHASRNLLRKEVSANVLVVYQKSVIKRGLGVQEDHDAGCRDGRSEERIRYVPQRLQINSRPLLDELESITGATMTRQRYVMVPPFKAIVSSREKIQQEVRTKRDAISRWELQDVNYSAIDHAKTEQSSTEMDLEYQKTAADHLECLLTFIDTDLKDVMELRTRIQEGTLGKISFSNLWHLFTPGDVVFANSELLGRSKKSYSYLRAFVLYAVSGGRPQVQPKQSLKKKQKTLALAAGDDEKQKAMDDVLEGSSKPFLLDMYSMEYDGECLTANDVVVGSTIPEYKGEKLITDLEFYPAKFSSSYEQTRQTLIDRGRRYVRLLKDSYKEYQGLTMGEEPEDVEGEVITDAKTGYFVVDDELDLKSFSSPLVQRKGEDDEWMEPRPGACSVSGCEDCTFNWNDDAYEAQRFKEHKVPEPIDPENSVEMASITENHYLLLPKDILGFVLRIRKWKYLDVNIVQDSKKIAEGGKTPFEELVIEEEYKKTIVALIQSHSAGPESLKRRIQHGDSLSMDLVKGKGRGLVILLHGAPGVGKTSTAETVAAHTNRPLYPITCGDLGTTATQVETALERHFKLAHKWGTLEYYSGILILTTNRVGEIDEAFHSRIKMSFYYQPLNEVRTMQIWSNCLDKIKETSKNNKQNGVVIKIDKDERNEILSFASQHFRENLNDKKKQPWNGRQIRNAFQTSLALADYDRLDDLERKIKKNKISLADIEAKAKYRTVRLKVKHFRQVAAVTADYYKYVNVVQKGKTNEDMAAERALRANDSDLEAQPGARALRQSETLSKSKQKGSKIKEARPPSPEVEDKADSDEPGTTDDDDDDDDDELSDGTDE